MYFSNTDTNDKPADPYTATSKDDVSIKEKVKDLSDFINSCQFGILTTRDPCSGNLASRCMTIAAKEYGGIDLIFYTNTESGKTNDIKNDPHVNVSFLDSSGQWASFSGTSTIITETDIVKKYYSSLLKAWLGDLGDGKHDGSSEDPRLGVIRVESNTITYAVNSKNALKRGVEVAQGVISGKTPDIHKLRDISKEEVLIWRSSKQVVE